MASTLARGEQARRRPVRIVICLAHFHPVVAGAERQMFQLAQRWSQWGHPTQVLTRRVSGLPRHEVVDGVEIRRVIHTVSLGPLFGATFIASLARQLRRYASSYDVILDGQMPWEAVASGLVCRRLRKPVVVVPASTGPLGDARQILSAKGGELWRRLVLNNTLFLSLSSQTQAELLRMGCSPDKILPITNGVDLKKFQPTAQTPQRERTVLYLARLVDAKNPQVLLRAWKRLGDPGRYRLLIAGGGPLAPSLQAWSERENLQGVTFLGHMDDVPAAHRRAGVYVLPSPSEGCSNALLEAMASGLCPVVTRVPGNVDVIQDGANGLLFDHDDDLQLASVLSQVLADDSLRSRLASAARGYVEERHDLDKIAARFVELFQDLVDGAGATPE